MSKLIKIIGRIVGITLEWFLIALIVLVFVIRTSAVQTYFASLATDFLSKELKTTFQVKHLSIVFLDEVLLEDVLVLDQKQDTLAYIPRLFLTLDQINLTKNEVTVSQVLLKEGRIKLNRAKETGDYNYWFITDYFAGEKKGGKTKPLKLNVSQLKLLDVDFDYDDYRKGRIDFGMDYNHLKFTAVNLLVEDVVIDGEVITGTMSRFSAEESCGFSLSNMTAKTQVSPKGVLLRELMIKTPNSTLNAKKLNMLTDRYQCFYSFEDSVRFDADLSDSKISLLDVSYFGTALEGMDHKVVLKAKVTHAVKDLQIKELDLRVGKETRIKGDFKLPDFRNLEEAYFEEYIAEATVDLQDLKKIKLPNSSASRYITFDKYTDRLAYFHANKLRLKGNINDFTVGSNTINTEVGDVAIQHPVRFRYHAEKESYSFSQSGDEGYDIEIQTFDFGKLLNDKQFGKLSGDFSLNGELYANGRVDFTQISGDLKAFYFKEYNYQNIIINAGTYIDNVFEGKVDIKDDNLSLEYEGKIDLNGSGKMDFTINLTEAILENLNLSKAKSSHLKSNFDVDLTGLTANGIGGKIKLKGLAYTENNKTINLPELIITVQRGKENDKLEITSGLGNIALNGKIDFESLISDFESQFSQIFPAIIKPKEVAKKANKKKVKSHFEYDVVTKSSLNDFLEVFLPALKVSDGTTIKGKYDGDKSFFMMDLSSDSIHYEQVKFHDVKVNQSMTSDVIQANYDIGKFFLNDSISVSALSFSTSGSADHLSSKILWNPETSNSSSIQWETDVLNLECFDVKLLPSYFSVNSKRWNVEDTASIQIRGKGIDIDQFLLEREKQFLSIDGKISDDPNDKLNFKINDFRLDDFSSLIDPNLNIRGVVNGWGYLRDPYHELNYMGDAKIQDLFISEQEVGSIFIQSEWNSSSNSVGLKGDLTFRGAQTFAFQGDYFTDRKKNNLDFNLDFDGTDIQVVNAFMDPDLLTGIRGDLNGQIKVTGDIEKPDLDGTIFLNDGHAKVELLGVGYGFNGKITCDADGFYLNNMPVEDEEGNMGKATGTVLHSNFTDWILDLSFNLEDDANPAHRNPLFPWKPVPLNQFLTMNTSYKEGDIYYGKAYATGNVNIFGYTDNLEITVNMETKAGTKINFPMYGTSEIDESSGFIVVNPDLEDKVEKDPKLDFTGVDLNLNFKVTPEAQVKLIFNETNGDEMWATGSGNLSIGMNNIGDLTMDGVFKIKKGDYNFVLGPLQQKFFLEENGSITWTGDPYNAMLDISTYCTVNASIEEILGSSSSGSNTETEVQCKMLLSESLMNPAIKFDIKAPKASDANKTLLGRVTSDPNELNRQFFSLLLAKRFLPLPGTGGAGETGGGAALDLLSSQVNSMLDNLSKDVKFNLALDKNNITNGNSVAFGVSKSFLEDRLILKGSFGVQGGTSPTGEEVKTTNNQSNLIGDVSLEYLLNEQGTFRVSIFNESNNNQVIVDQSAGNFLQGAGLHYQEEFDDFAHFKLVQYFFDLFRPDGKKRFPDKKKRVQTRIPESAVLPEKK
jgi:hypothetical protein